MFSILGSILIAGLILLATLLVASLFIGMGYVLALIFHLSLYQSTMICIAVVFFVAFLLFGFYIGTTMGRIREELIAEYDEDEDEDDDEEEDDEYEEEAGDLSQLIERIKPTNRGKKVGRNELCPCGSGKKYKYCCEKDDNDSN